MSPDVRSLRWLRVCARAPRHAVVLAGVVLALAGVRAILAPTPGPVLRTGPVRTAPIGVGAFAEAFAREYLSWTADDIDGREQRLDTFLARSLDPDAGLVPGVDYEQRVVWTSAARPRAESRGSWAVDVTAALEDGRRVTVSVPVASSRDGLAVTDYPAPAALAMRAPNARAARFSDPVDDAGLEVVVTRAVRNFLAGRAGDLLADLAPGARVSTPDEAMRLLSLDELAWTRPGSAVAALVHAELPGGARARMRLHLRVRREGRWFITSFTHPTTTDQGAPLP